MTISQKRKPTHNLSSRESLGDPSRQLELKHFNLNFFSQDMFRTSLSLRMFCCKMEIILLSRAFVRRANSKHIWHKPGI